MGEIADDMVNGLTCSLDGVLFVEEHGYPVLCAGCWEEYGEAVAAGDPPMTPEGWQKATLTELSDATEAELKKHGWEETR